LWPELLYAGVNLDGEMPYLLGQFYAGGCVNVGGCFDAWTVLCGWLCYVKLNGCRSGMEINKEKWQEKLLDKVKLL
jgi:hypothetical protein